MNMQNMSKDSRIPVYAALIAANLVYAFESVFVKLASGQDFLSARYFLFMGCAVGVLGVFALIWQQIIKRIPVSEAYMFKGSALIFVLLLSVILFGESISLTNVIGACMIVLGIVLYARL